MKTIAISAVFAGALTLGGIGAAQAWEPTKPIEFVVTSGAGGGTDNFARIIQSIITKHKFTEQPIVVVNKGGGSGAEGYVYGKGAKGDPNRVIFGTNNAYLLPYVAKLGYKVSDLTPVAALALDEFLLWVKGDAPYADAKAYIEAVKAKPMGFKMGGSQSKDTDQTLTSMIQDAAGVKWIYVPFQGGSAAAVQLAGGHIDSNTNNPNENIGQWKAGQVKPLCVFSPVRLAKGEPVFEGKGWGDVPTCKEAGLPLETFQMPRTVWLPADVPADAVTYYAGLLEKVSKTPEWQEFVTRTAQTAKFMKGKELADFVAKDETANKKVFENEGWVAK
ncbi:MULTISPECIES: tripartite tricarboxylate transporter substrate binding protein [Bosea]|jgi:putative tricarboxylic transport membrane protein|uniref:Bug family tripartite tricarboxylate transporter substrate binding protein n=1 Tax=Bosea TaxID=85413 RepID=UPI00214FA5F9|nr:MULTISPECIES: tripartite tricarboxylate transporter substrate-binding protein [Bosea]MCR4523554.1 tripartite tricarboxylate transporter substrate-binding protein [Bosea sp. 47.2.35]MDR6830408.1 tripartite-type tricarboxylate transporter receptor subunit TctC [Bosea robiniae]MDR6897163.1 tripartite-type tricarboxylate transporter receptor subunit TctC [Bosea sp. BE109]MDR7140649.1 tripartite-type tricarboxylate transporter receptor subunit TctC [Bosea sp. BE168]MDR7177346.1 tripartite-type t